MQLYFLRHAQAEDGEGDDQQRNLTPQGKKRAEKLARVMAALGLQPAHIYSSPRVRAHQTAVIVAAALHLPVEVREEVNLDFNQQAVDYLIADLDPSDEVLFVGHEPSLSSVVQELTGATITMKRGSLARVDLYHYKPLRGKLVWLIAPKVFEVLGGK